MQLFSGQIFGTDNRLMDGAVLDLSNPKAKLILPPNPGLSVGLVAPSIFSVVPLPAPESSIITLDFKNVPAGQVLAGPTSGAPGLPTFRALVASDIPGGGGGSFQPASPILSVISGLPNASGWLHNNGSGVLGWTTPTNTDVGLGNVLNVAQEPALGNPIADSYILSSTALGVRSWVPAGTGAGTVTNVASGTGLTGGPITTTGTLAVSGNLSTLFGLADSAGWLHNNGAGVLAWSTPPASGTVTSVASGTGLTGGPITTSGTLAVSGILATLFGLSNAAGWLHNDGSGVLAYTTPSGVSGANPTANVSNTAVNGSAATFMRSDAAPSIATTAALQFATLGLGTAITVGHVFDVQAVNKVAFAVGDLIASDALFYFYLPTGFIHLMSRNNHPIVFTGFTSGENEWGRFSNTSNLLVGTTSETGLTGGGNIRALTALMTGSPTGGTAAAWWLGSHGVGSVNVALGTAATTYNLVTTEGVFGGIYVHDGVTGQSIPTGSTYTQLTCFNTAQGANGDATNCTPSKTNNKITVGKIGKYLVTWSLTLTSGTNNVLWNANVFVAGTENVYGDSGVKSGTGSDEVCMSGVATINVTSLSGTGGDVDLRIHHDNGGSVTITPVFCNLVVNRIGD